MLLKKKSATVLRYPFRDGQGHMSNTNRLKNATIS